MFQFHLIPFFSISVSLEKQHAQIRYLSGFERTIVIGSEQPNEALDNDAKVGSSRVVCGAFPLQETAWEDKGRVVPDWQDLSNLPIRNNSKAGADVQG